MRKSMLFLVLVLFIGCGKTPEEELVPDTTRTPDTTNSLDESSNVESEVSLKPIMTPVKNRDIEANRYKDWKPTEEQLASLKEIRTNCKGNLKGLLNYAKWSGNRLRVTGWNEKVPITQDIGSWHIILIPESGKSIVELKGLLFAKNFTMKLDLDRDVLIVKETEFKGTVIKGESAMSTGIPYRGVSFKRQFGLVMGRASILLLEDGSVMMDFHNIYTNGLTEAKAGEYGTLKGQIIVE